MTVLVVGATGATGKHLVQQLLDRNVHVKAIVRALDRVPLELRSHPKLTLIEGSILELPEAELSRLVGDCGAVLSCLGHTLSFKGIFGPPHRLVHEAVVHLCTAIASHHPATPVRFILMNTSGNSNRDLDEKISFAHKCVVGLLRVLLPPHVDNEQAADYLRTQIGQSNPSVEWVAVRPDSLINENTVSDYDVHPSPTRDPIFNAGKTSRINVAHFMSELVCKDDVWNQWKGAMPVLYNTAT